MIGTEEEPGIIPLVRCTLLLSAKRLEKGMGRGTQLIRIVWSSFIIIYFNFF